VNVPVPDGELGEPERGEIARRFHDLHEQLYAFRQASAVELVNFRLAGFAEVPKPELRRVAANGRVEGALKGTRDVDFDELGRHESSVYERSLLGAGAELEGPAMIEEPAASTVIFPGQRLRVDELGNLIVETAV
jgi:N-methylhydantoinase A